MRAYFTVEAACILPIIFGVYVFIIYAMLYQYDRCLLEQDVALLVLKTDWEENRSAALSGEQINESEAYLVLELEENVLKEEWGEISAWAKGKVNIPFYGDWGMKVSYTCGQIRPVDWIRMKQK